MSVASPKAQAKSPIDLDEIIVCRKREALSQDVPSKPESILAAARAVAAHQIGRFNKTGRRLSENDVRVVVTSQVIRWLSWRSDPMQGVAELQALTPHLEVQIAELFGSQQVEEDPVLIGSTEQLSLL